MTLIDVLNVPQISDPQLSLDGKQVLLVRSGSDWKANRRIGHIWRIGSDGSNMTQLTIGADGESGAAVVAGWTVHRIRCEAR